MAGINGMSAMAAAPVTWSRAALDFVAGHADQSTRSILEIPDVVRSVAGATAALPEPAQATLAGAALLGHRPAAELPHVIDAALGASPAGWGLRDKVALAASAVAGPRPAGEIARAIETTRVSVPAVMDAGPQAEAMGIVLRSSVPLADVPVTIQSAVMRAPTSQAADQLAAMNDAFWPTAAPQLLG